jgi:hypothetical protein
MDDTNTLRSGEATLRLTAALLTHSEAAVETLDNQRGTHHALSEFHGNIFASVFEAFVAALDDSTEGKRRIHVVSAPVGAGKTTMGMACVAGLINSTTEFEAESGHKPTALIVVEQVKKADETYRTLCDLIGPQNVAVWTREHDAGNNDRKKLVDGPAAVFSKDDLKHYPVAIVTHALFKGKNSDKARLTADGRVRTFTLIDEQIKEVTIYDIDAADIHAVRKRTVENAKASGEDSAASKALDALDALLAHTSPREGNGRDLEALGAEGALAWFSAPEARHYALGHADEQAATVFGFGRCLADGYAFLSRTRAGRHGIETRYIGYEHGLRLDPGTVLLDATADLDGMTQLAPWRIKREVPVARYDNLTVIAEKPYPQKRLDLLFKKAQGRRDYAAWMIDVIKNRMATGERALVVCKLALLENENIVLTPHRFPTETKATPRWVLGSDYAVDVATWGDGIGSNSWQDCTTVFLFGDHYTPRRIHVADAQGMLNRTATDPHSPLGTMATLNTRNSHVDTLQDGHLLRCDKQMALRGAARKFDDHGHCGKQTLVCCGDPRRLLAHFGRLYPGAKLLDAKAAMGGKGCKGEQGRGTHSDRLLALLSGDDLPDMLTTKDVGVRLGIEWRKHSADILTPTTKKMMATLGWRYEPGRGRQPGALCRGSAKESYGLSRH